MANGAVWRLAWLLQYHLDALRETFREAGRELLGHGRCKGERYLYCFYDTPGQWLAGRYPVNCCLISLIHLLDWSSGYCVTVLYHYIVIVLRGNLHLSDPGRDRGISGNGKPIDEPMAGKAGGMTGWQSTGRIWGSGRREHGNFLGIARELIRSWPMDENKFP